MTRIRDSRSCGTPAPRSRDRDGRREDSSRVTAARDGRADVARQPPRPGRHEPARAHPARARVAVADPCRPARRAARDDAPRARQRLAGARPRRRRRRLCPQGLVERLERRIGLRRRRRARDQGEADVAGAADGVVRLRHRIVRAADRPDAHRVHGRRLRRDEVRAPARRVDAPRPEARGRRGGESAETTTTTRRTPATRTTPTTPTTTRTTMTTTTTAGPVAGTAAMVAVTTNLTVTAAPHLESRGTRDPRGVRPRGSHASTRSTAGMVYGICRALLRDGHEAEDAAQQTFLLAHRALLGGAHVRNDARVARDDRPQRVPHPDRGEHARAAADLRRGPRGDSHLGRRGGAQRAARGDPGRARRPSRAAARSGRAARSLRPALRGGRGGARAFPTGDRGAALPGAARDASPPEAGRRSHRSSSRSPSRKGSRRRFPGSRSPGSGGVGAVAVGGGLLAKLTAGPVGGQGRHGDGGRHHGRCGRLRRVGARGPRPRRARRDRGGRRRAFGRAAP